MARAKPKKSAKTFTVSFFMGLGVGLLAAWVAAIALAYFAWWRPLMASAGSAAAFPAPEFSATPAGKRADYSFKYSDLDGKEHDLGELKGKVLFLNFWATWCGPCVAEMPGLAALAEKSRDPQLVFMFFSKEKPETVKKFLADKGFKLPVYLYNGPAPSVYKTDGIPATFIISSDGKIVFEDVGAKRWDDPAAVTFLKKLAGKKAEAAHEK